MKVIRTHRWGGPENLVLEEVAPPVPGPGQALVKVNAASLNFPDLLLVAGKYQLKPPLPFVPGLEVSGIVESIGAGVEGFKRGDRVLAQTEMGGVAEFALAPATAVQRIPDQMSDEEAAAFSLVYQTSYFALKHRGGLRNEETV